MKILIVEDDKGIVDSLTKLLKLWKYEVVDIKDFSTVLDTFILEKPDLILMDVSLPFFDGYHWCQEIRKQSKVPILFISSSIDNMSAMMAMNLGADDFVVKPFDSQLLIVKIQAILRRAYDYGFDNEQLEYNGLILNTTNNTLIYQDNKIELTKNEYKILLTLLQNKGKIVSREKLMNILWNTDAYVDENTLTVNINRLRKKLDSYHIDDLIKTKVGLGYCIE